MRSNKRVFATNNDINFNDYLQNKNGIEIIKNIKSKKHINQDINKFVSYNEFITLTKTFYKYLLTNKHISIPNSILESRTSFIVYHELLSHMKDCSLCRYCKNIFKLSECKEVQNILYPYGHYIENPEPKIKYISYPNRINLNKWCKSCKSNSNNSNCNYEQDIDYASSCESCRTCLKRKTIYPSQNVFITQQNDNEIDFYEQMKRMDAYAIYPNINNCLPIYNKEKSCCSTKISSSNNGLCKNAKPLFVIPKNEEPVCCNQKKIYIY